MSQVKKDPQTGQFIYTDPGFLSTSKNKATAKEFRFSKDEPVVEVVLPKGAPALELEDLYPSAPEGEVLVQRGQRYLVKQDGGTVKLLLIHKATGKAKDEMPQVATDPPVSEAQRRAMWAAAAGHSNIGIPQSVGKEYAGADPGGSLPGKAKDMMASQFRKLGELLTEFFKEEAEEPEHARDSEHFIDYKKANGVAFVTPDGKALFLKRSANGDHAGEWGFPGGMQEEGETGPQCAIREVGEEIGRSDCALDKMSPLHRHFSDEKVDFTTYAHPVEDTFTPKLNYEHDDWQWAYIDQPPEPLHPGMQHLLKHALMGEVLAPNNAGEGGLVEQDKKAEDDQKRDQAGKFSAESHPASVEHEGKQYGRTGKTGTQIESGEHSAEYTHHTNYGKSDNVESRAWHRLPSGKVGGEDKGIAADATQLHETEGATKYRTEQTGGELEHSMADAVKANQPGYGHGGEGHPKLKQWATAVAQDAMFEAGLAMDRSLFDSPPAEIDKELALAYDRDTGRQFDNNGNMHVAESNISKSAVNPYLGKEINQAMKSKPGWVPLDDQTKYFLFRHPDELLKGAPTFNNLPILNKHVPISASKFDPKDIIGSTGTDAKFVQPYLQNSLAFWRKPMIDEIEDNERKQLSAAYSYDADMTPGEYEGQKFDGIMRNIKGNHVALVKEGRAGPDVVVCDEQPMEFKMATGTAADRRLRRAKIIKRLAMDASPEELAEVMEAFEDAEDTLNANGGMPPGGKRDEGEDRMRRALDAMKKGGASDEECKEAEDAMRKGRGARAAADVSQEQQKGALDDEDMNGEDEWGEEEEKKDAEDRARRSADAKMKLGRDETPDERDCRERAEDARRGLGRDESEEEKEEREGKEAEDRSRRAADARSRLGRDESPEEMHERCESERGEDRKTRRAADAKRRAEDKAARAADGKGVARDNKRAADSRRAGAMDEMNTGGKMDPITQPAMDAAIAKARRTERENQKAIRAAISDCKPWTGDLPAMDEAETADGVYRTALEFVGVADVGTIHPSAYKTLLHAQPRPGQARAEGTRRERPSPAMDSAASAKGFGDRFGTNRIQVM